ncbi:helix-turn-helix domain-containing protein [Streptomyces sp. 5-8]|uniref:Helix-turn-helix domain-containing protein n=1 Tax=Streptomyces musisoli TaxID=2802280 RepID=A0ABS1NZ87_9ACTN|nr:helix-turn-helix domain-containing protein [Streptomyces musisoli]
MTNSLWAGPSRRPAAAGDPGRWNARTGFDQRKRLSPGTPGWDEGEGGTVADGTSESAFAELLRELKNRSGHSYGTLAKRLHMSTSTLHRYCNGDAVPTDYAPVERLARLCKATPGELVELHRRWVLADAVRGRKGAEPARAAQPPAPERRAPAREGGAPAPGEPAAVARDRAPEPEEQAPAAQGEPHAEAGSRAAAEPGSAAAGPGPVSAAGPDAERVQDVPNAPAGPESVRGPGPVPGSGPEAGPESVRGPGAVPEPERVSDPVPESERGPGRVGAAGARRRGRTVLLAALTVTALLGGVAVALNLPSGDERPDGKGVTATSDAAVPGSAPTASTGKTPSPRRSTTPSASPSAKAPKTSATADDTPTAAPRASTTPPVSAAPPLAITTHPYAWQDPCSQHYLIDRPPADVSPPPLEQDAPAWVDVHHAVSSGEQYVTFTVQGTGNETVVLEQLSVRMAGKRSPLAWNDYAMGYPGVGCGGGVPDRSFTVALDAMRPAPVPVAGSRDFPFKVSRTDPEVFRITADASAYDVSWYLELQWSSGTRHGTMRIDDSGRPFHTSGNNGRPAYAFPLGGEKWEAATGTN